MSQRLYRVKTVGKLLKVGPRRIFRLLRDLDFLDAQGLPTPWVAARGLAYSEERRFTYPAGGSRPYVITLVTEAGYWWIREHLQEQAA